MRSSLLLACALLASAATGYREALPGYRFEFPRDHFSHPEFRTEWWYYTGNLRSAEGRRFGYELTFFRHAARPDQPAGSVWEVRDVWLAHFAISDVDGGRFLHTERISRTGPGLAGADPSRARIWNGNWHVRWSRNDVQQLQAIADTFRVQLSLTPEKPPLIHGQNGVSQKSPGAGRGSHYVSFTRLRARGQVEIEGRSYEVEGLSWMDHEFFSHQLAADQQGWDWFSIQLEDRTELMLFRLRRKDGTVEPLSHGTYVDAAGTRRHLAFTDFSLVPGRTWKSPNTGAVYPIEWRVNVPSLQLELAVRTRLPQQELIGKAAAAPVYWEGAMDIEGTRTASRIGGVGYLEMTGYAGAVRMGD